MHPETKHTCAASLHAAILSAAAIAPAKNEGRLFDRALADDESIDHDYLDGGVRYVRLHGPCRPMVHKIAFCWALAGARGQFVVQNNRARLLALADIVRKQWALFGGGTKPADMIRAPRQRIAWPAVLVKVWREQCETGEWADALRIGLDKLGGRVYVGKSPFLVVAPQPVDGISAEFNSGRRDDGKWVVFDTVSGAAICSWGANSRAAAEEHAAREWARKSDENRVAAMRSAHELHTTSTADALAAWCKAHRLDDAPAAPEVPPLPEVASEPAALVADAQPSQVADDAAPVATPYPGNQNEKTAAAGLADDAKTAPVRVDSMRGGFEFLHDAPAGCEFVSRWAGDKGSSDGVSAITAKLDVHRKQKANPGQRFTVAPVAGGKPGRFEVRRWQPVDPAPEAAAPAPHPVILEPAAVAVVATPTREFASEAAAAHDQAADDGGFSRRVTMAAAYISSVRKTTRAFDSCFEMYDGDAVAVALLRRAEKRPGTNLAANLWRYIGRASTEDAATRLPAGMTLAAWALALVAERGQAAADPVEPVAQAHTPYPGIPDAPAAAPILAKTSAPAEEFPGLGTVAAHPDAAAAGIMARYRLAADQLQTLAETLAPVARQDAAVQPAGGLAAGLRLARGALVAPAGCGRPGGASAADWAGGQRLAGPTLAPVARRGLVAVGRPLRRGWPAGLIDPGRCGLAPTACGPPTG